MSIHSYDDDDLKGDGASGAPPADFECPNCNAHNPGDEPLSQGDEVLCNYCGAEFEVKVLDGGRIKLREI